jgi:ElaB/YqjD/DUF883 family membrane-anchored ribosome-binding protein
MEVYFGNLTAERGHADKLAGEIESLLQNAEELVQSTGSQLPAEERQRLGELLARLKSSAAEFRIQAVNGLKATDRVIRKHPYQSAGIALGVGLLVGVLVGRSRRDDA